ncbi:MAG: type II toxin-antitoxin system HicB family antitoxin [Lachnospiraceae bacterium]|nr:type II toxin-antitoxin system HicB family antitoxin [Lachnospiraceae bacterium]
MKKLFYPAVFHKEGDGFWVSFPDFPECLTEGDDMESAYEMAVEALGLSITSRESEKEAIPEPSDPSTIDAEGGTILVVNFDMMDYLKKHNSRAVKKTLSIPEWLNEAATSMGVNFSQVLQEALMQKVMQK